MPCRHIESLELRLEATERRLDQLSGRFDRVEGSGGFVGHLSERPDAVVDGQVTEGPIEGAEPETAGDSVDATDGVGSVIFTKKERVDAGFFGTSPTWRGSRRLSMTLC